MRNIHTVDMASYNNVGWSKMDASSRNYEIFGREMQTLRGCLIIFLLAKGQANEFI